MNRAEFILSGLVLLSAACKESAIFTPTPTVTQIPNKVTIYGRKPFVTFPHGIIANFTDIPITIYPKNLERISVDPLYGINAEIEQVGIFVITNPDVIDNSPTLRPFLHGITPSMEKQYAKEQGHAPIAEFARTVSLSKLYREKFAPVPLIDINLPILAQNLSIELNLKWARFMHSEVKRQSKIPYAEQDLSPDAIRQICFDQLFVVPELSAAMAQSLRGNL